MNVYWKCKANPSRNASRTGLLTTSAGRWFHSLAVLGKKEYMWALILEYGMENLLRNEGVMENLLRSEGVM